MLGSRMRAKSGEGVTCEECIVAQDSGDGQRSQGSRKFKMSVQCDVKGTGHGVANMGKGEHLMANSTS